MKRERRYLRDNIENLQLVANNLGLNLTRVREYNRAVLTTRDMLRSINRLQNELPNIKLLSNE